jgi:hypothetical protein
MSLAASLAMMLDEATEALSRLDADRLEAILAAAPAAIAASSSKTITLQEAASLQASRELYDLLLQSAFSQINVLNRVCVTGGAAWAQSMA